MFAAAAAAAPPAAAGPAASRPGDVRDPYGFVVKPEFRNLYLRFASIYAAEEAERAERWGEFMAEAEALLPSLPGEGEAAMLRRLLAHLEASSSSPTTHTSTGSASDASQALPPGQAAALLQRLASLVQAGLPMAKRGAFWRLFLNVDCKKQEGEYAELLAEVEAMEQHSADSAARGAGGVPPLPGMDKVAAAYAHEQSSPYGPPGSVVSLVADSRGSTAAACSSPATRPRASTFSLTPLDDSDDEASMPLGLPTTPSDRLKSEQAAVAAATPCSAVPEAQAPGQARLAALTPASTLQTPQSSSSSQDTGGSESGLPSAAGLTARAERWRQQDFLSQIDKDLHRTFPDHPCMDENGRATLRRILAAYALRNPTVGYCQVAPYSFFPTELHLWQGLNFLAATFLLFMPEEDAFWCLCALIEDILGPGYFDERMVPVQVDVLVFGHLLQGRFPTLWAHLQALDVDAASVTMHWFLCCFLNSLPLESTLRVWDQLFFEGSPVVLFRSALALVEIYDQALMCTHESSDAYMLLQVCAQMTYDSSRLVDTAAIGYAHLQPAGLAALRQRYRPGVLDNMRNAITGDRELQMPSRQGGDGDAEEEGGCSSAGRVPSFAGRFRRLSSVLLEAEEVAARQYPQQQQQRPLAGDGGHLTPQRSSAGSSRRSSPGPDAGQPASPLARMQHAMRGLTSRLVPSAMPLPLPSGALTASGQELDTVSAAGGSRGSGRSSNRGAGLPPSGQQVVTGAGSETRAAPALRTIMVGHRNGNGEVSSPASGHSLSATTGAALGRQAGASRFTPFSEVPALEAAHWELQGSWLQRQAADASTPVQRLPPRWAPQVAVVQSQPATPTGECCGGDEQPPLSSQRRVHTAGYPGREQVHTRRRRRLTIDIHSLANPPMDLQRPAMAAALAIAANPSPHGGARASDAVGGGGLSASAGSPEDPGVCGLAGFARGNSPLASAECEQDAALPVRVLRFDEHETPGLGTAAGRTATAPAAVLLAAVADAEADASAPPVPGASHASAVHSPARASWQQVQAPSLLPVLARLQEEVAVAESRRHAAESEAGAAQQFAADLRRQLRKVQQQVASKEALSAELSGRLAATEATLTELRGELAAKRLAVAAEQAAVERRRHESATADALIRRLMDAVAHVKGQACSPRSSASSSVFSVSSASDAQGGASPAASAAGGGSTPGRAVRKPRCAGSPQSSIGSVAVNAWGSTSPAYQR